MPTNFPDGVLVGTAAVVSNTGLTQVAIRLEGDNKRFRLYDQEGLEFCRINGAEHLFQLYDQQGKEVCRMNNAGHLFLGSVGSPDRSGGVVLYNEAGNASITLRGQSGSVAFIQIGSTGSPGALRLRNSEGQESLLLDGARGDITLHNADCAEDFPVSTSERVEPGSVVVLDDDGRLAPCREAYDPRVVGVISGGQGEKAGIILGRGKSEYPCAPVALVGTVYCKVTAEFGPIGTGGLLTTSPISGHAMQADDLARRQGAVIGKALRRLDEGTALLPILVMLR